MPTKVEVSRADMAQQDQANAEKKAANTDVATVSIPEMILLKVIALLTTRRDSLIEACLATTDSLIKLPAKLWRAALTGKVAPDDVTAFVAVYRAIRQGISLGIPKDNFKLMPIPTLRAISKGILDGKSVTRETYNMAMNTEKTLADVIGTFDADTANAMKAKRDARAKESKEDKIVRAFVDTITAARKSSVNANRAFKLALKKLAEDVDVLAPEKVTEEVHA